MKYILLLFFITQSTLSYSQKHCGSDTYSNHLSKQNPNRIALKDRFNTAFEAFKSSSNHHKKKNSDEIINIPVVFHILYKTAAQNISNNQIYDQIDRLNKDYSATNIDTSNVPLEFQPFISDTKIRFTLADTDPNGNSTTGIVRYNTDTYQFSYQTDDIKYSALDGADAWDTDKYLNIWVGHITNGYLGYATQPIDAGTIKDGVVLGYEYVGNTQSSNYNKGRTATHEIGHYFGLDHIWGQQIGCSYDDGINDTPNQESPHYGVQTHPIATCNSNDMFMNYMDYGNDEALVMFTLGQKEKMEYSLDVYRSQLGSPEPIDINLVNKLSLQVYPNPVSNVLNVEFSSLIKNGKLYIIDITGRTHYSQYISYKKKISIPISHFNSGLYFIGIKEKDKVSTLKKIIIQ